MKKNIKDYLHLYIGAMFIYRYVDYEDSCWTVPVILTPIRLHKVMNDNSIRDIKLLLRPLNSMTEEERYYNKEFDTFHISDHIKQKEIEAQRTLWLLSKHFDLFGLIEAGLVIDKTTLK